MTPNYCLKASKFLLTTVLSLGVGFMSPAFSQESWEYFYLIDTNNKTWTRLDLGQGSYGSGSASALNDFGQVTGDLYTSTGPHAFITGPNGVGIRDLGTFYGADATSGASINNAGQVGGGARYHGGFIWSAFITGPNGAGPKMIDEDTWTGDLTYPADINEAGQLAGTTSSKYLAPRAFITGPNGEGITDIGNLGGRPPPDDSALGEPDQPRAIATGINETGQVVGHSDAAGESGTAERIHAFITGPDGAGMRDLGTMGGAKSYAFDINDAGQVVGYSDTAEGPPHAFITGPGGMGMRDL